MTAGPREMWGRVPVIALRKVMKVVIEKTPISYMSCLQGHPLLPTVLLSSQRSKIILFRKMLHLI